MKRTMTIHHNSFYYLLFLNFEYRYYLLFHFWLQTYYFHLVFYLLVIISAIVTTINTLKTKKM